MGFWFFMLGSNLLIPAIMILFGWMFKKSAPKDINDLFGYRTVMSKKNQETWQFAHEYMGKKWFKYGLILLPITIIAMLPLIGNNKDIIGGIGAIICLIELIPMFITIIQTENALRKTFDKDGNKKIKNSVE